VPTSTIAQALLPLAAHRAALVDKEPDLGSPDKAREAERHHSSTWYLLGGLLGLALIVRLWDLSAESLWEDEIRTARLAGLTTGELLRRVFVEREFAVPVLHILLSRAALVLHPTDASLRLVSVLLGLGGVAAVFKLGREAHGNQVAWISALLVAVSPGHIEYSREARPYAMLVLVVALLLWAILRALRTCSSAAWFHVGCLAVIVCNTSFLGVFPTAAAILVGVGALLLRRRGRLITCLVLPIAACTPVWLAIVQCQKDLILEGRLPMRIFTQNMLENWMGLLGPGSRFGFLVACVLAAVGAVSAVRNKPTWAILAAVQILLPFAVLCPFLFNHNFAPRYLLFLLPPFIVLQAGGIGALSAKLGRFPGSHGAAAMTLGLIGLNLLGWGSAFEPRKRDWHGAAGVILEHWPAEVVVLSSSVSPALPVSDPTLEYLGYYLGDKDGYSMPCGKQIASAGRLGPAWLNDRLSALDSPVCAVLLHDMRTPPCLPAGTPHRTVCGITVVFDDHSEWQGPERAAMLLLAQAWAAVNGEEKRCLLRRSICVAQSSRNPQAVEVFAEQLDAFRARFNASFSPREQETIGFFGQHLRLGIGLGPSSTAP
jgi:hypothetical protein